MKIKKIVALMLALAMVVSGLYIVTPDTSEVKAADTTQSSSDALEPNVVADGMLNVKMQIQTNQDSEKYADGSVNLRLVSSVNGLGYKNVGFEVYLDLDNNKVFDKSEGSKEFTKFTTGDVSKRINASVTGVTYNYSPKVIDTDAEYFVSGTLMGINKEHLSKDMYVRAFCTTMDGKVEYGTGRYFNITDATAKDIINIPVKMDAAPTTGENNQITGVEVKLDGSATSATLENYDDDGYAHVNVVVPSGDKTALDSATKVEIGDASAIHRNLESAYTGEGSEDTSWYDEYIAANSGETEFVIATAADLYGLSNLAQNNDFVNKRIYVVADIDANDKKGTATATGFTRSDSATPYPWTPIGDSDTSFVGTFDGQNHIISGVYFNKTTANNQWGLFGTTGDCNVKNFTLANSYMAIDTTSQLQFGSIAGKSSGTFDTVKVAENVYLTHANTNGTECTGGIVGEMTGTGEKKISNCWFAGQLVGGASVGGVLGHAYYADIVTLENCLNSGDLLFNKIATSVGGICGEINHSTLIMRDSLNVGTLDKQTYSATSYGSAIGWIRTNPNEDTTNYVAKIYNTYALSENGWNKYAYLSGKGQSSVNGEGYAAGQSIYPTSTYLTTTSLSGEVGYVNMNLDFTIEDDHAGYWTVTDGTPVLSSFLSDETVIDVKEITTPRTAWYASGTYENTDAYTLYTKADMYGFASLSDVTFEGKTVQLGADITMNEGTISDWEAASYAGLTPWTARDFAGIFDGDNHTIQGVYLDSETGNVGLFATVSGTVKNLMLQNSYFNCKDTSAASYESMTYSASIGSIAGNLSGGTLDTVYSDALINHAGCYAGGLVGTIYTEGTSNTITNSCYAGKIVGSQCVGGILGALVNTTATIEHCLNVGEVTGGIGTAGYCGYIDNRGLKCSPALSLKDSLSVGPLVATDTQTWRGAAVGYSRCSSKDYLCAKLTDTYAVAYYEDDSNPWVRFAGGGTNGAIDVNGTVYSGSVSTTPYFWTIQAVKNKVSASGTEMNLSFYEDGLDSSSDGETKTCWWVDEEGQIPMLESFADLLRTTTE